MNASLSRWSALAAAAIVVLSCGTIAPRGSPEARARLTELEARFLLPASSPDCGTFEASDTSAATHVRAVVRLAPVGAVAAPARVELPRRAGDPVKLRDEHSGQAVQFSLQNVHDALIQTVGSVALYAGALKGSDVVHRVRAEGTEDFVVFETRPAHAEIAYAVDLFGVAGLRLVGNTLELLDDGGAPRLRVAPPYVTDASAARHPAVLTVEGCAYDTDPAAPWGRKVTAPGASRCSLLVSWAADVRYPAMVDPAWTTTGSMTVVRFFHTATLLASGKALLAGGTSTNMGSNASAELYDPTSGTFAATGSMSTGRVFHTATALASGNVLVVGGAGYTAELYDPVAGTFRLTGETHLARGDHTATELASGEVLIAGGAAPYYGAELYDPAVGTFTATGSMGTRRAEHTATRLASGKVLLTGGNDGSADTFSALASADLYDPATGTFAATGAMGTARAWQTASLLGSGKVLVAGGTANSNVINSTAELYDPATGTFSDTGSMQAFSGRGIHTASVLGSGAVLLVGGLSSAGGGATPVAELYDPASGTFSAVAGSSLVGPSAGLTRHTETVLSTGRVLVAGGRTDTEFLATAALYGAAYGSPCDSMCGSSICEDGICCATACAGVCRTCAPGTGACVSVTSADDPNTCTGKNTCDAAGACKLSPGQPCADSSECAGWCNAGTCERKRNAGSGCSANEVCASGYCTDGLCCDRACAGNCEACDAVAGTCTLVDGPPHGTRPLCAMGTECLGYSSKCEAPTVCDGDHLNRRADGTMQDCAPYKCRAAGGCRRECVSVNDCIAPAVCDTSAKCILPPGDGSAGGCTIAPVVRSPFATNRLTLLAMTLAALMMRSRRRNRRRPSDVRAVAARPRSLQRFRSPKIASGG